MAQYKLPPKRGIKNILKPLGGSRDMGTGSGAASRPFDVKDDSHPCPFWLRQTSLQVIGKWAEK